MEMGFGKNIVPHGDTIYARVAGRVWVLRRSGNLEDLWDSMDGEDFDEDAIPYWTELWPSSIALANWLCQRSGEIAGEFCLDAGCGLGLTTLVGQVLGAKMSAFDHDLAALRFCRENAEENRQPQPVWIAMDWRAPAFVPGVFRYIWGADILYEKRFMAPVADFINHCLAPGGKAWIAEPGRGIFAEFLAEVRARGWRAAQVFSQETESPAAGVPAGRAAVWEIAIPAKHGRIGQWAI